MATRELDSALRHICESGAVPGLVAMATNENDLIYRGAFGKRDISGDQPMTPDSVFWIASMTKAITATAAMQLVERGKLSLDGPLGDLMPELAAPNVLDGFDADGTPKLRPAKTALTLRHLLTHTSGFCYDMWNAGMVTYLKSTGTPGIISCKNAALTAPLVFDPGTRWEYGIGIDVVGKVVEAASGQRLGDYFRDNLLGPLGMDDTSFRLGESQRSRRVAMHRREADGGLTSMPFEIEQNPEFEMGGGGLYGTASDYLKFTRMILNKGRAGGEQLLQTATVEMMAQNQMGGHDVTRLTTAVPFVTNDVDLYPGMVKKWGLSFLINTEKTPEGRSRGSLAWAGLANTYYWIDPVQNMSGVILMQVLPFADAKCLDAFTTFERGIYQRHEAAAA